LPGGNASLRPCGLENDMVMGTSAYKSGIRATMFDDDDKLWSETIAERLARSIGHPYTDITKESVGSWVRRQ
jgi:hypothetical protein